MKKSTLRITGFILLIVASLLISDGFYIKFKAVAAQHLLQRAWLRTVAMGKPIKPWPWADTWPVARLKVDRLGVDCIILDGDSGEVLAFGPGHITASTPPTMAGNCGLVGHRDTSFRFLKDIEKGDVLHLQGVSGHARNYQVVSTVVRDYRNLFIEETVTPWLTLITCYPFSGLGSTPDLRFIVFARELAVPPSHLAVSLQQ